MVSKFAFFMRCKLKNYLTLGAVLMLLVPNVFTFAAAEVVSWEAVDTATISQGKPVYVRGSGYYSNAAVTSAGDTELSDNLRLVITSSSHTVTNADGTDDNGFPYFDLTELTESTRVEFATMRARFAYSVALYQGIEGAADADGDGIPDDEDICPNSDTNDCITITGIISGGGASLQGAAVKIGTNSVDATTDIVGEFTGNVGNAELAFDGLDDFFPVNISADGFASGYAKVIYVPGQTQYELTLNLQQVSDTITEEDNLDAGVELTKGGEIVGRLMIPESALPENVEQITGSITYLDPETDDILSTPGGDLLALREGQNPNQDTPVPLETFGMMEFDLQDQNGVPIHELSGMAEVCMKATSGLVEGDVIPLWYYDEEQGLWIEEGEGTVVDRDGELQICGGVTHFSWWNYDQPITTHSCLSYQIQYESTDPALLALDWYAEGATYNGSSPARACADGNDDFAAFTVKITTDDNNPEKIKVYTLIGGTKFYLAAGANDNYSLTQINSEAVEFKTPSVNGSCLTGNLTGTCLPLDHETDANGIIPVSSEINLPPVITDFIVPSLALFPADTANISVFVTDPEGLPVSVDWQVSCGFYGNDNGGESIIATSPTNNVDSGSIFTADMNAPAQLNYPIEYCHIAVTATDSEGITGLAERWVTVAASTVFEYSGILYGTDGEPVTEVDPDTGPAMVRYDNWSCNIHESFPVDDTGAFYRICRLKRLYR